MDPTFSNAHLDSDNLILSESFDQSSANPTHFDIESVYKQVGGFGRFQLYISIFLGLSFTSTGYLIYSSSYLEYDP